MRLTRLAACLVLLAVSLVSGQCPETPPPAASSQPRFDPKDVVRHVRARTPPADSREPFALDEGEFLVDTSIAYAPAPYFQEFPSVAFDGANFLVVWEDRRSGSHADVFGARVSQTGTLLDPSGIAISTAAFSQSAPSVAYDGANFLVVWHDSRDGGNPDIYGARVSPDGSVLDPAGIVISVAAGWQESPTVYSDGTVSLVAWMDNRNGENTDIYGTRVSQAGTVLDPDGIVISADARYQWLPAIASDGTSFFVVWTDERSWNDWDIYGARVSQVGAVLDSGGIAVSTAAGDQFAPAVTFDGASFLAVWDDSRSSSEHTDIYGARVSGAGVVLDPEGIAISAAVHDQLTPAVAFGGTNSFVVWTDELSSDVYGARVTPAGVVLDPTGIAISTAADDQSFPAVGFDGENFLVVWQGFRRGPDEYDIYGARVDPTGVLLDTLGIAISMAALWQVHPTAAFDGTNFLLTWRNARSGGYDVCGARVDQAGTVLDANPIGISTAAEDQMLPSVAFDGTNFLVVWEDWRNDHSYVDIFGARVDRDGTILDPDGIAISTATDYQGCPKVAFDGTNYLAVWEDTRGGYSHTYGARVAQNGTVLDPSGFAISTADWDQVTPVVAFDGMSFLVVWEDDRGIYGARVSRTGIVLDPNGIAISAADGAQIAPAVAFDGTNYLAVWEDTRGGYSQTYGARVAQTGTVLDPEGIAISSAASDQYSQATAFNGTDFLVAWRDRRSVVDDIHGAWVSPGGTVSEGGPIVTQGGSQWYPALARGSGSQMLLVYQGWGGTVGGKTYNTDRIWGKMNPVPGIEETPNGEVRTTNAATIVRGVLFLAEASNRKPQAPSWLLDISGRKVADLHPGANDVRALAPGVYFVRELSAVSGKPSAASVRKVVLTE